MTGSGAADQCGCSVVLAPAAAGQQVPNPEGPRQIQIFRGAQQFNEAEVLVDEVQERSECIVSRGVTSVVQHIDPGSWVSLVDTSQDLDEGGLARAVLTDDGEDLAPCRSNETLSSALVPANVLETPCTVEQGCLLGPSAANTEVSATATERQTA